MSIKRLLTTTAAFAALAPGLAHAAAGLVPGAPGIGTPIITDYELASEAMLSGGALATTVGLRVGIEGTFPPGQNILFTLNVQGGTFTSALTGAAEIGSGATGATVNSGGAKGGTTVRYLATADAVAPIDPDAAGPLADSIGILLPITFAGCPSTLSFTLSELTTESGTIIEGGTATLNNGNASSTAANNTYLIRCVDGIKATLVPDFTAPSGGLGTDSKLALTPAPTFSSFFLVADPDAGGLYSADIATAADIGYYDMDITAGVVKNLAAPVPAAVVAGDVTGFTTTLTFSPATNVVSATATPDAGDSLFAAGPTAVAASAIALNGVAAATNLTNENGVLRLTINGTGAITPQTPAVSNCAVKLGAGFVATDPCLSASVDDLDEAGLLVGPWDWVGDFSKPTQNIFRVTGLGSTLPTVRVKIANASAGASFNGTYTMSGLALSSGGELIINTQNIQNAVGGNFGRADVSFLFVTAATNGATFDVDRLMSTGGIVSSFVDGATTPVNTSDGDDI